MIGYFDTSALLKFVLEEEGSAFARRTWGSVVEHVTSAAAYPEARAALAGARRAGRLSSRHHSSAVAELDRRFDQLDLLELRTPLAMAAGAVADRHRLRGYDAVHLASALATDDGDTVMITWDEHLARASTEAGLAVAPS